MEDIGSWEEKFEVCCYSSRLLGKLCSIHKRDKDEIDFIEIKKAIYYAKKYHGAQRRDAGEPYYSHPLEVAYTISDYLFRTDIIVTSILHDTLEDTNTTFEMIESIFSPLMANPVKDLTRIEKDHGFSTKRVCPPSLSTLMLEAFRSLVVWYNACMCEEVASMFVVCYLHSDPFPTLSV